MPDTSLSSQPQPPSNEAGFARRRGKVYEAVWEWIDRKGLEWCVVCERSDSVRIEGRVVAVLGENPIKLRYEITLEPGWVFHNASVSCELGNSLKTLHIQRTVQGVSVAGEERPDLTGCVDIDLMTSPLTNTLPIRRLRWKPESSHEIFAAYIRVPELSVERVTQRYSLLGGESLESQCFEHQLPAQPTTQSGSSKAFEYHSAASGFRTTLHVDANGLVCHYPPYWLRLR